MMFKIMTKQSFQTAVDAQTACLEKEIDALRDRLSAAIGRNLNAQMTISQLRPLAKKYTDKLERDRTNAANKRKAAK